MVAPGRRSGTIVPVCNLCKQRQPLGPNGRHRALPLVRTFLLASLALPAIACSSGDRAPKSETAVTVDTLTVPSTATTADSVRAAPAAGVRDTGPRAPRDSGAR